MPNNHDGFIREFKNGWINAKMDREGIDYAEDLGLFLCAKDDKDNYLLQDPGYGAMTNSQIRNVFGEVKRIQEKVKGDPGKWKDEESSFLLLRPKIAYAQARVLAKKKNSRIKTFKEVLEKAHQQVNSVEEFHRFAEFFEAVLAYHKAFGGKES